ncbi:BNR repeat-containing protein [bacterium]|nr:BNR repeat-containing protein [bacterium]
MRATAVVCLTLGVVLSSFAVAATLPPVVRGGHGVWLRVDAGALQLKLYKRDLNIYEGEDTLHAALYDPQRRMVATLDLPDGAQPRGKAAEALQSAEVKLPDAAPGVYRLQISGSGDCVWGLDTNAPGAVVQGDITLNDGAIAGRLLFAPPADKFTIKAQALHDPGRQQMPLLDDRQQTLKTFDLGKTGVDDVFEAPAGERTGLWRLDIAHMHVKIVPSKAFLWTLDTSAWFEASATRWMLVPYRQARYLQPGGSTAVTVALRNSTAAEAAFAVRASAPPEVKVSVAGPSLPVTVKPGDKCAVTLQVTLAPQAKAGAVFPVTVTAQAVANPAVITSAGVEVRVGASPVGRSLALPIALQPYEHESFQFGYAPDFEPNEVYFDLHNSPVMRQRTEHRTLSTGLQVLENGRFVERSFMDAIKAAYPTYKGMYGASGFLGAKVAFDGAGWAHTMLRIGIEGGNRLLLLATPDMGRSWQVAEVPGSAFDIEQFTGHNALQQTPPVLAYVFVKEHPATFAAYHDLFLYLPRLQGGRIVLGDPVKVAENCVGSCQHSGGPASTSTRDGKTHIVWGEIAPDDAPGVPTYVATYDQATGKVSEKVLLGYAPPVNDVHNVPAICQDSQGYIHVILGSHGQPFQYVRSLRPNDASAWTKPEPVLSAGYVDDKTGPQGQGRQTYCSLVCGPDDTLYIAYRQWRRNADPFHPDQIYAALSVQSKPKEGPWGPAQPMVVPPVPGYSIYYHKLTIDRRGRLFLSYSHWTNDVYQEDWPDLYHNRALVMSADGGKTWKLATTDDLAAPLRP